MNFARPFATAPLMIALTIASLSHLTLSKPAHAAGDSPQFLGQNRDAAANYDNLLTEWPKSGPKVLWSTKTGPGFGGAAIVDGQAYILDRAGEQGDTLRVINMKTGKDDWQFKYDSPGSVRFHGSRCTPTVDGDHVYTVGPMGDLHCISIKTKKSIWNLNLAKTYKFEKLNWGHAQSPLIYKDTVIVTPTHAETPALVAFNKLTGKKVWEAKAPKASEKYSSDYYSSPIIRQVCGVTGIMQITNGQVSFINPDDGEIIWQYNGYQIKFAIPSPTVMKSTDGGKSNRIFVTGGYDDGSVMIKVAKNGNDYKIDELFRFKTDGCQIHPAVEHDGYLYANINENSKFRRSARKQGGLVCIDPNKGKIIWRSGDKPFLSRGGIVLVAGHIIALDGELGNLHLAKATPKGYTQVAQADKVVGAKKKQAWAPLAFSNGLLIVRDQTELKCLDLRDGKLSAK